MLATIYHKPRYVHSLSLQDAIYRAQAPKATDREIVTGRHDTRVSEDAAPNFGQDTMLVMIDGVRNEEIAEQVYKASEHTVRSFLPPNRPMPKVRVRFTQ